MVEKKKNTTKKKEKKVVVPKRKYFLPSFRMEVEAGSITEAVEIAKKQKNKKE